MTTIYRHLDTTINAEALTSYLGLQSEFLIERAEEWHSVVFVTYVAENGKRRNRFVSKKHACYPASITYEYEGQGTIKMIRTQNKGYQVYVNNSFNRYQPLLAVVKGFERLTAAEAAGCSLQFTF